MPCFSSFVSCDSIQAQAISHACCRKVLKTSLVRGSQIGVLIIVNYHIRSNVLLKLSYTSSEADNLATSTNRQTAALSQPRISNANSSTTDRKNCTCGTCRTNGWEYQSMMADEFLYHICYSMYDTYVLNLVSTLLITDPSTLCMYIPALLTHHPALTDM